MKKVLLIKALSIAECDIIKRAFPSSEKEAGAELVGWPSSSLSNTWIYKVTLEETHPLANKLMVRALEL